MKKIFSIMLLALTAMTANAQDKDHFYPGGPEAMQDFFDQNIVRPESAADVVGVVYVMAVIDKKGQAHDIKVSSKSKYPELDKEAVRVVKLVKNWVPQKQDKPVIIQVQFKQPDYDGEYEGVDDGFVYPGGEEAWRQYVRSNFRYPESLVEKGTSGTLFVNFNVDPKGKGSDYQISTPSQYPELDAEAVRIVSKVKKWNPAKTAAGKPYETRHIVRVEIEAPQRPELHDNNGYQGQGQATGGGPVILTTKIARNPSFPGGAVEMAKFISKNTRYPERELRSKVSGNVDVAFTVMPDGTLRDPRVVRPVSPGLDREALRIVSIMPKWEPCLATDGTYVPCEMTITVPFHDPNRPIDGVPFH